MKKKHEKWDCGSQVSLGVCKCWIKAKIHFQKKNNNQMVSKNILAHTINPEMDMRGMVRADPGQLQMVVAP